MILIGLQLYWRVCSIRQHIGVFRQTRKTFFGYAIISSVSGTVRTDASLPCTCRLLHQISMQSAWDYVQELRSYLVFPSRDPLSFSL